MPAKDISAQLEKDKEKPEWIVLRSDLSGGCGHRYRKEWQTDLRSQTDYWFGRLDTFIPGQTSLPLISNTATFTNKTGTASAADTTTLTKAGDFVASLYIGRVVTCGGKTMTITSNTTDVLTGTGGWSGGGSPTPGAYTIDCQPSGSQTQYVHLFEWAGATGGTYLYLAVGEDVYRTNSTAFTLVHHIESGQGRHLNVITTASAAELVWAAGPDAHVQYTTNGTSWTEWYDASYALASKAVWRRLVSGGGSIMTNAIWAPYTVAVFGIGGMYENFLPRGSVEPFFVMQDDTATDTTAYIANGDQIIMTQGFGTGDGSLTYLYPGLTDITAACQHSDEMALVDAGGGPYLWYPGRPLRPIPLWREDGCPSDLKGRIKGITSVGTILMLSYELDAGGTMIFWGRHNIAGQWTWHYRAGDYTGGHCLGSKPMIMARASVSSLDRRRFWTITGDGSTLRAYYQDHPLVSWNPLTDTAAWVQFKDGPAYTYLSWEDLQLMGDEAGALMEVERNGICTASSKTMSFDARTDYNQTAEESATWDVSLLTIDNTRRTQPIRPDQGLQALSFQGRLGMDRDSTATNTPVLYDLGITVKRQARHPVLRRK